MNRCGLIITWLAAALPALAQPPEHGFVEELSRFERTVTYLQASPAAEQADFATAALIELAEIYMAEADLARAEAAASDSGKRSKLLGWSMAVDQYASQLMLVLDDLEQEFPMSLRRDPQGSVSVTVADRTVMLSHPRADQQPAFEQRVLANFCSRNDCQRMMRASVEAEPIPASITRVNPQWTFTRSGPVCANDGLEVHFSSTRNLAALRAICEELVQELAALATDLGWQRRHGVAIDWDSMAITATPGRPEHLVRLNAAGDSALLTLPLLFASPDLLADIKPWLRARAEGREAPVVRLDAAVYGWLQPAS